jgi:peptidoglycan/LPS O-acetylase OafA/YrhL
MPARVKTPPEASAQRGQLAFLPGLEGLRGVAVLVILIFHAELGWLPGGFLGVSTFFTLSGFLITRLLVGELERSGGIDLRAFYTRRGLRILPAAFVALAVIVLFGAFAADLTQKLQLRADGLSALFYVANWWLVASGNEYASQLGSPSPVQHFWSLAIEEQFYLFFPWMVLLTLRRQLGRRGRLVVVLAVLIPLGWLFTAWLESTGASSPRLYYGTDTRSPELFAGSLLALYWSSLAQLAAGWRRRLVEVAGVAGLALSAYFWLTVTPYDVFLYRGGLAIYTLASVVLLASASLTVGPIQWGLSLAPLRWLGRVSYGVYLYHWPIFLWLDAESTGLGIAALTMLRVGVTLVVSELSYRFLEEPIRRGRWLSGARLALAGAAAAVAVLGALVFVTRGLGEPASWLRGAEPVTQVEAVAPDALRVAMVGDSVSEGVGFALRRWSSTRSDMRVRAFCQKSCGVGRGGYVTPIDTRVCDDWEWRWRSLLEEFRPQLIVMLTAGWDLRDRQQPGWDEARAIGDPVFDAWLRAEYEAVGDFLTQDGAQMVFLTSPCIRYGRTEGTGAFEPERTIRFNETILAPLVEGRSDASSLDLFEHVCRDGAVLDTIAGIEGARPDGIHFSDEAADWIARWLGPELLAIAAEDRR